MVLRGYDHETANVKDNNLFCRGTRTWDAPYIKGIFSEEDAQAILNTPISNHQLCYRLVWFVARNGVYNAKYGYRYWIDRNRMEVNIHESPGWSKIWKLQVPHKARIFLWRLRRNNLSVCDALIRKGINLNTKCPFCTNCTETVENVFLECNFARSCWQEVGLHIILADGQTLNTWLLRTLANGKAEIILKITYVLWGIWFFRNKKAWKNKLVTTQVVVNWSSTRILEWQQAREKAQPVQVDNRAAVNQVYRWKCSNSGTLKINVDIAVPKNDLWFSVGMIMRDST